VNKKERKIRVLEEVRGQGDTTSTTDPYSMFLFTMRSSKTREKCTGRLHMFFDFIGILGDATNKQYIKYHV
jgi:hypothetical protein